MKVVTLSIGGTKRIGVRRFIGSASANCPVCHAGLVDTLDATEEIALPNGLRWLGVPCDACGRTFTIEMLEPALEDVTRPRGQECERGDSLAAPSP